jgi:predicted acyltransferase
MEQRFNELDIVRGLSVVGMILVTVPGAWEQRFMWLNHAEWRGANLSDMIFPTFLFCVGFSFILSINNRISKGKQQAINHILIRGTLLIVIGIAVELIPDFNLHTFRIPGILQRIGTCYIIVGLLIIGFSKSHPDRDTNSQIKVLISSAVFLALLYWVVLNFIPISGFNNVTGYDPVKSWPAFIDRHIFGINHLWPYGQINGVVTYDPDGLLSTFPACINVIIGAIMGLLYKKKEKYFNLPFLFLFGFILILFGWLLDIANIDPMIKKIWTPSFALLSSGFSIIVLAFVMISNKNSISKIYYPAKVFGANALLGFIISIKSDLFLDKPVLLIENKKTSLRDYGFNILNETLHSPQYASFLFSILFLTVTFLILLFLYKKRWFVKL